MTLQKVELHGELSSGEFHIHPYAISKRKDKRENMMKFIYINAKVVRRYIK